MKTNMGYADRITRMIIAIVLGVLWYKNFITGTQAIILFVLAGIFVVTSFFGFCPLYKLVGLNTCSSKKVA